jgi:probable F420-dependent oxidoreductase
VSKNITFGVSVSQRLATLPSGDFDPDAYADMVRHIEQLGYDQVMIADHVFVPDYWAKVIGDLYLEPFTLLSYLAARTSVIELVFACLVVPYRQPLMTAKAVATLDQLSGGRFALGIVPGYLKEEFQAFGLPRQERNEMTDEFVRIMIELWTSANASYQGRYYSFNGINVKPKCRRKPHVPIWVGGSSKNALHRVAEFGDVWHPLSFEPVDHAYFAAHREQFKDSMQTGGTTPERLRTGLAYVDQLCAGSRDLSSLDVVVNTGRRLDDQGSVGPLVITGEQIVLGGARVLDWFGQFVEAGATGFSITPTGNSAAECLNNLARFAQDVIPQFRDR